MQQLCSDYSDACHNVICQSVDVDLPISLRPSAKIGNVKIACCGEPHIELCRTCCDSGGIELHVTQTIVYKIPLEYGVDASSGDLTSDCRKHCGPRGTMR